MSRHRTAELRATYGFPMEIPVFDLSLPKLLILAVIALVVFGPNELPKMAAKAGGALRELRKIAEGAKSDLREGLGPEFDDFDLDDLNPRRFVQKHLLSDQAPADGTGHDGSDRPHAAALAVGEEPPYDAEAT
jgi:sec-independent protein translocase protein TatB